MVRRFANRSRRWIDSYITELIDKQREFVERQDKIHRCGGGCGERKERKVGHYLKPLVMQSTTEVDIFCRPIARATEGCRGVCRDLCYEPAKVGSPHRDVISSPAPSPTNVRELVSGSLSFSLYGFWGRRLCCVIAAIRWSVVAGFFFDMRD